MKKIKFKHNLIFYILYGIGFLGAAVLGLLSNSFFAYEITEYIWADVLYVLFLSLLYITAYVQTLTANAENRKPKNIVYASFLYLGCLLLFLLFYFIGGIFSLISALYSAAMLILVSFRAILKIRATECMKTDVDAKSFICAMSLDLFAMISIMPINYVSEIYMAWAFIPATILSVILIIVILVIIRNVINAICPTKRKKIGYGFLYTFVILIFSYGVSFPTIGIADVIFDKSEPAPIVCEVLDKNVSTGTSTPTTYELKVKLNGKEQWIDVPSNDYYELSKGDSVVVNYYSGALGFAYYIYVGKEEQNKNNQDVIRTNHGTYIRYEKIERPFRYQKAL